MSCSPVQATSASPIASCISPWLRSARRIERTPPRPSVRCSTKRRQFSPALACGFGSRGVRHLVSGLPSPARRSSAAPRRPLPRFPDRRRNRTFLRYTMSGGLNIDPLPPQEPPENPSPLWSGEHKLLMRFAIFGTLVLAQQGISRITVEITLLLEILGADHSTVKGVNAAIYYRGI